MLRLNDSFLNFSLESFHAVFQADFEATVAQFGARKFASELGSGKVGVNDGAFKGAVAFPQRRVVLKGDYLAEMRK